MTEPVLSKLEQRLGGRVYARQRLKIETDREAQVFGPGLFNFFHIGDWYPIHSVIRILLKLTGMYWRGRRNTARVQVRHNDIHFRKLPPEFDGFTLLHISDFHADMNDGAMRRLEEILPGLSYDGGFDARWLPPLQHRLFRVAPRKGSLTRASLCEKRLVETPPQPRIACDLADYQRRVRSSLDTRHWTALVARQLLAGSGLMRSDGRNRSQYRKHLVGAVREQCAGCRCRVWVT
jgi:hypothetical protein